MIPAETLPLFLAGLVGGVHCLGMCGGLVAAFTAAAPAGSRPVGLHVAYNLGRIASYAGAGAIAGSVGMAGIGLATQLPLRLLLMVVANLLLVAMALYLMGLPQLLLPLERLGGRLWQRLQPWSRRFLPVRNLRQAAALGLLWGWLPCGLVYSALATALASGSTASGALAMAAFGLGTLPNLMLAGLAAARLRTLTSRPAWRIAAGLVVMAFALHGLASTARIAATAVQ